MLENGFVKIYRSFLGWEWYDDINTSRVFLHLILTANYEDKEWHGITIKRGSRVSSWANLANETGLSVRQCRTAIHNLETTGEVTRSKSAKYTVFSIRNYDKFQVSDKVNDNETTSKRQATGQGNDKVTTSKRQQCKKDKKDKKDKKEEYIRAREENSGDADTGRQFELPPGQLTGGVYHINEGNDF